jgi:hypothetical protein
MASTKPLSVLWERDVDVERVEHHNATHPEPILPGGWSEEWVLQVLLAPNHVRPSLQEAQALKNWTRAQR